MAKVTSREKFTVLISLVCPKNTPSSLPSWFHNSATSPLLTSMLYAGARMTESTVPFTMPASWAGVSSARIWGPCINVIRLWCICSWGMASTMEDFNSQTQLLLDTGAVPSTLPLNDITDTFNMSSTALPSRHGA